MSLLLAAGAGEPIRVAAPGLKVVNLEPASASFYNSNLAQLLNYQGVRVSTQEELGALLGFERQQQLLGCTDDRCRSAIAATVGVDALLVGQVAKLEGSYQELTAYLERLEQAKPKLLWSSVSLSAEDHPRLVLTLTVYSLSLERAWLIV